ncbi:hypothetical protein [Streptomyces bacillaris]|uniref:hypothetical protein n=1 Tax=Streptomyces bacillaris TaxID=68179 RepID=UPI003460E6AD
MLKERKEQLDKEREPTGRAWRGNGLVFTTPTGGPLDPANLTVGVYAHVRLRLQCRAIDTLGKALGSTDDGSEDPPAASVVR